MLTRATATAAMIVVAAATAAAALARFPTGTTTALATRAAT